MSRGDPVNAATITRLLHEWQDGSEDALDRLVPLVYDELRTLASRQLAREWRDDRLETTAVVNEAYVKLFGQREVDWQNRGHFFALAAKLMRRLLVDHARRHLTEKRGRGERPVELDESLAAPAGTIDLVDAIDLDRALQKLDQRDPGLVRIVELRFFGGLTVAETAAVVRIVRRQPRRHHARSKLGFDVQIPMLPGVGKKNRQAAADFSKLPLVQQ